MVSRNMSSCSTSHACTLTITLTTLRSPVPSINLACVATCPESTFKSDTMSVKRAAQGLVAHRWPDTVIVGGIGLIDNGTDTSMHTLRDAECGQVVKRVEVLCGSVSDAIKQCISAIAIVHRSVMAGRVDAFLNCSASMK